MGRGQLDDFEQDDLIMLRVVARTDWDLLPSEMQSMLADGEVAT